MRLYDLSKIVFTIVISFFITGSLSAQTLIFEDNLQGSTKGTVVGGKVESDGYKPGRGSGHILYTLSQQVKNGKIEFEMQGFTASAIVDAEEDADNGFVGMYDGRGISEPIQYFDDFKTNFFRWNFHFRQNRNAFKCVIQCAEPTSARLNASKATFGYRDDGKIDKDWGEEPTGKSYSTNSTSWYKVVIQWKDKHFTVTINGTLVWEAHGPYDYAPVDHRIWLGSAPGHTDKYVNSVANTKFRNFKVYTYGSSGSSNNLSVSPSNRDVGSSSGSTSFSVSSNVSWKATDNANWITTDPSSGSNNGSFNAKFDENTSTSSRTATITVEGGGITRTVTVKQAGKSSGGGTTLTVSPSNRDVGSSSGSTSFTVNSNVSWKATDNANWITTDPSSGSNNGSFNAKFDENTSTSSRTATITVEGGGITRTVTVKQAGKSSGGGSNYLNVPASLDLASKAGTTTVKVESNVSWTVKDNTGSGGSGWLSKSPKSGTGDGTVTVRYYENTSSSSRSGSLIFTGGGITKTVSITQEGKSSGGNSLSVSPSSTNVGAAAGSTNLNVSSNVSWSASVNQSWVTLSPTSGSNNGSITANFGQNSSSSSRSATVTVSGGGLSRTATITQAGTSSSGGGNYINVPSTLNLPKGSGSTTVNVESNVSWTVRDNTGAGGTGWISKSPKTGTGNGSVSVRYLANGSNDSRSGQLIFTGGGVTSTVQITQSGSSSSGGGDTGGGKYLNVPEVVNISRAAGSIQVQVESNVDWTVRDNTGSGTSGWISKSPKSGSGDGTVTVKYLANTSGSSRSGELIFTGGGMTKITKINQSSSSSLAKASGSNSGLGTEEADEIPTEYSLSNYPNPFNPTTSIKFTLPEAGHTELFIYNALGQLVEKLVSEYKNAGVYNISYNASNLSSGVYFYTLRSGKFVDTNKMLLLE